jgi:ATP-binding cassette subfamily F protein 3
MLLELQNLGKSFGEHEVLRDVNAGVERGDRIGIIGANGTGKTTLLRILCGESLPDAGDAAFGTGVTTGYLEQNARLDPTLDVYATMKLVFTPALDAMQQMETLQKQLAADPHNAELTEKIAHCTAVIDAMDAYNMDTQIKKVLNGMGFPADTWAKLAGVLSGMMRQSDYLGELSDGKMYADSGRADEPPGPGNDGVAGKLPEGLPRCGAGRQP